jgi:hypothetical protein
VLRIRGERGPVDAVKQVGAAVGGADRVAVDVVAARRDVLGPGGRATVGRRRSSVVAAARKERRGRWLKSTRNANSMNGPSYRRSESTQTANSVGLDKKPGRDTMILGAAGFNGV